MTDTENSPSPVKLNMSGSFMQEKTFLPTSQYGGLTDQLILLSVAKYKDVCPCGSIPAQAIKDVMLAFLRNFPVHLNCESAVLHQKRS